MLIMNCFKMWANKHMEWGQGACVWWKGLLETKLTGTGTLSPLGLGGQDQP